MHRGLILAILLLCIPAFASGTQLNMWPPDGCSAKEPRVATWQNGTKTGTRCMSAQEILRLALPDCKAGQLVMFDGENFACKDAMHAAKTAQ
jgi:hypothetical protein